MAARTLGSVVATEQCVRCERECADTDPDFTDGETTSEGEHICQECLTVPEMQAQDRDALNKAYTDREDRLRRMADQHGLRMETAQRRDQPPSGVGAFQLVNPSTIPPKHRHHKHGQGMSLDEIEDALTGP